MRTAKELASNLHLLFESETLSRKKKGRVPGCGDLTLLKCVLRPPSGLTFDFRKPLFRPLFFFIMERTAFLTAEVLLMPNGLYAHLQDKLCIQKHYVFYHTF